MNDYKTYLRKTCSGLGFFVFVCLVFMVILVIATGITGKISTDDNTLLFLINSIASLGGMLIPGFIYCGLSKTQLQSIVPFKKVGFKKVFLIVLMGLAVAFLSDYLSTILNYNLSLFGITTNLDADYETYSPLENILYVVSVAIVPAIGEEFAFRGILLGKLRKFGDTFAIVVSAVMFGLMHGNLVQIPFAFILGLVFAFIVVKTNSLLPTIIIHFLNNFISVLLSIIQNSNIISEDALYTYYCIFMLIVVAGGTISAFILSKSKDFFVVKSSDDEFRFKDKITSCFTSIGMVFVLIVLLGETLLSTFAM